jgi:uncharacterized protein YraI
MEFTGPHNFKKNREAMKITAVLLSVLFIFMLASCSMIGGPPANPDPRPTNTPLRWYPPPATLTPVPTVTDAPDIPVTGNMVPPPITVSTATNCRTGPSADYVVLLAFMPGQTATVIGKYTPTNYWVIQTANGYTCWLWGEYATIQGTTNLIPDIPAPPLPTEKPPVATPPQAGNTMATPTSTPVPPQDPTGEPNPTPEPKPTKQPKPTKPPRRFKFKGRDSFKGFLNGRIVFVLKIAGPIWVGG